MAAWTDDAALISYDAAVRALACHFAVAGPPTIAEFNKARSVLWGCLSVDDQSKMVLR